MKLAKFWPWPRTAAVAAALTSTTSGCKAKRWAALDRIHHDPSGFRSPFAPDWFKKKNGYFWCWGSNSIEDMICHAHQSENAIIESPSQHRNITSSTSNQKKPSPSPPAGFATPPPSVFRGHRPPPAAPTSPRKQPAAAEPCRATRTGRPTATAWWLVWTRKIDDWSISWNFGGQILVHGSWIHGTFQTQIIFLRSSSHPPEISWWRYPHDIPNQDQGSGFKPLEDSYIPM